MDFTFVPSDNHNAYDQFLAASDSGSFLQSWDWGRWQEQLGHTALRVMIQDDSGPLLTAQAIAVRLPRLNRRYLYIPYGPVLSKNLAGPPRLRTVSFLVEQLRLQFPDDLFIRLEPQAELNIPGNPTGHIQPGKTLLLDLRQSPDQLLAAMHPKTRYNIKVAQRHGIAIVSEPIIAPGHGLHLQQVLDLLVDTGRRQRFRNHDADYFKQFINFFTLQQSTMVPAATVYKAMLGQQVLAAAIMMDFGSTRTYLFGGTSAERKNTMAPYALHWQAIQDARNYGRAHYDFWGIETACGQTPGFVRFKLGWGGQTVHYPPAVDVIGKPLWYNLYTALRFLNRKLT